MKIQLNGVLEATFLWVGFGESYNSIELSNEETEITEIYGRVNP